MVHNRSFPYFPLLESDALGQYCPKTRQERPCCKVRLLKLLAHPMKRSRGKPLSKPFPGSPNSPKMTLCWLADLVDHFSRTPFWGQTAWQYTPLPKKGRQTLASRLGGPLMFKSPLKVMVRRSAFSALTCSIEELQGEKSHRT